MGFTKYNIVTRKTEEWEDSRKLRSRLEYAVKKKENTKRVDGHVMFMLAFNIENNGKAITT